MANSLRRRRLGALTQFLRPLLLMQILLIVEVRQQHCAVLNCATTTATRALLCTVLCPSRTRSQLFNGPNGPNPSRTLRTPS